MPKKRVRQSRSQAAKKGWRTRRAQFRKRSRAARKGWKRRKAKAKLKIQAKRKPISKGKLGEWVVAWSYKGKTRRMVGFVAIARNDNDASLFVTKAVANGTDSTGADLTWMESVPWNEVTVTKPEVDENGLTQSEIRAAGEGYIELR